MSDNGLAAFYGLKHGRGSRNTAKENRQDTTKTEEPDEPRGPLVCAACGAEVTYRSWAISVDGAFEHVFTNPHGYVFRIGCFSGAPGVYAVGEPTEEFAWFSGTKWQFAVCASCLVHLGWNFIRAGGGSFFALVMTRLRE